MGRYTLNGEYRQVTLSARELSYRELTRELLPAAGFVPVEQSCLYLELWLRNLLNDRPVEDHLQRHGNVTEHLPLMRRLFPLGRLLPWFALGIVVVARKTCAPGPNRATAPAGRGSPRSGPSPCPSAR